MSPFCDRRDDVQRVVPVLAAVASWRRGPRTIRPAGSRSRRRRCCRSRRVDVDGGLVLREAAVLRVRPRVVALLAQPPDQVLVDPVERLGLGVHPGLRALGDVRSERDVAEHERAGHVRGRRRALREPRRARRAGRRPGGQNQKAAMAPMAATTRSRFTVTLPSGATSAPGTGGAPGGRLYALRAICTRRLAYFAGDDPARRRFSSPSRSRSAWRAWPTASRSRPDRGAKLAARDDGSAHAAGNSFPGGREDPADGRGGRKAASSAARRRAAAAPSPSASRRDHRPLRPAARGRGRLTRLTRGDQALPAGLPGSAARLLGALLRASEERPRDAIELSRDPRRILAEIEAVLEDPLGRVLDLRPRRDRRHAPDRGDAVEEDTGAARFHGRVEERIRPAHRLSDGTVRPVRATIRWPSGLLANSTNRQASSLAGRRLAMQYASECRIPAGCPGRAAARRPSRSR